MMATAMSHYDHGYHSTHQRPLYEQDDYYQARAEAALEYFTADDRAGRVFDYGCGLGASIALLPNAEGWDPSPEARARARERGITVHENMQAVPQRAYDAVLCRHVLEHVETPLAALQTMGALLRPRGALILVLPIERVYQVRAVPPDENQHLYCWTPRTICNLLWRARLTPRSVECRYPFGDLRLMPIRRAFGARAYHIARRAGSLLRRNGELVVRAERVQ